MAALPGGTVTLAISIAVAWTILSFLLGLVVGRAIGLVDRPAAPVRSGGRQSTRA